VRLRAFVRHYNSHKNYQAAVVLIFGNSNRRPLVVQVKPGKSRACTKEMTERADVEEGRILEALEVG